MENTLNPQAVALTKAIRQHESEGQYDIRGASEEYGAYQWTPDTWKSHAKTVLGDENADIKNPTLQNKVAYSIVEKDLKSGLTPAEVAAKWNSGQAKGWENKRGINKFGVKYDVPEYVNSVGRLYTQEYQKVKPKELVQAPVQQPSEFNPLFPSSPTDTPFQTGVKTLGNVIPSAINFGKNVLSAINPINTVKNIGQIGTEFSKLSQEQGGAVNALGQTAKALPSSLYEGVVPTAGRELIKAGYQGVTGQDNTQALQSAQQAITEDPFGQIAPFLLGARQLAVAKGYGKQFDNFVKTGVDATLKPITAPAKFATEKAGQVARGGVAQATGLNPETVKALIDNPELYTKKAIQNINRSSIAEKVANALDELESQVSDTGTGYNAIRQNTGVTYIPKNFLSEALRPFKIKVQNGKIVTSAESTPLSTADITQLQKFVDDFGNERFLTNNAFLNARTALSDMSKYDAQKTGRLQNVSRTLREAYDAVGKERIEGLKNLDEQFAPLKKQYESLRKDYLTKENGEYVLKPNATTKIANLDKVGRERVLGRLEELVPDISKEIKVLKVVEDIERSSGIKVGTYGKGALLGAGLLSGGVVGAIISAILTSPEIAVPLIRGYGLTKNQTAQVLMNLRFMLGETKNSGMDLLQKEIPVEQMVSALTGKTNTLKSSEAFKSFQRDPSLKGEDAKIQEASIEKYLSNKEKLLNDYLQKNKKVVNTDEARKEFADVGYVGSNAIAVQEASSALAKDAWRKLLAESPKEDAVIYAGGSGTGKTTAVKNVLPNVLEEAGVILDGNLSTMKSAEARISEAVKAGKRPDIIYVYRDPMGAWVDGVIKRMKTNPDEGGRVVPLSVFVENHKGSYNVVDKLLQRGDVKINLVDNSLGANKASLMSVDKFESIKYPDNLKEILQAETKKLYEQGKVTKEQYEALIK